MKTKIQYKHSVDSWLCAALSAVSLFYVLYFFQAYQIETCDSDSGHSFLLRCFSFALLNGLVIYSFNIVFETLFPEKKKQLNWLSYLLQLLIGSLAIFLLFNFFWNWTELQWSSYQLLLREYSLVMLIPFITVYFVKQNFQSHPSTIDEKPLEHTMVLRASNGKNFIRLKEEDLLFVKACGNYIEVYYMESSTVQKKLLRSSMKNAAMALEDYKQCKRSHRGYLVNRANIDCISGAKGKMNLSIKGINIPVSAQYEDQFK